MRREREKEKRALDGPFGLCTGRDIAISNGRHRRDGPVKRRDPCKCEVVRVCRKVLRHPRVGYDPPMGVTVPDEEVDAAHEMRTQEHIQQQLEDRDHEDAFRVLEVQCLDHSLHPIQSARNPAPHNRQTDSQHSSSIDR